MSTSSSVRRVARCNPRDSGEDPGALASALKRPQSSLGRFESGERRRDEVECVAVGKALKMGAMELVVHAVHSVANRINVVLSITKSISEKRQRKEAALFERAVVVQTDEQFLWQPLDASAG